MRMIMGSIICNISGLSLLIAMWRQAKKENTCVCQVESAELGQKSTEYEHRKYRAGSRKVQSVSIESAE